MMTILFPLSLAPSRYDSFELALEIARSLSARIRILFVVDRDGIRRVGAGAPPGAIHMAQAAEEEITRRESSEGAEVVEVAAPILQGISAGATFMGANSCIGNTPNFMVISIKGRAGSAMTPPSFPPRSLSPEPTGF